MVDPSLDEPDYYAVLGVAPDATPAEVERAYRALASQRLNARLRTGRAARELAQINAAYAVLGYPERRADYDRRRAEAAAVLVSAPRNGTGRPEPEPALISYRTQSGQSLPRVTLGRISAGSPADAIIIVLVVVFSLFVASALFASRSLIDLSGLQSVPETLGLSNRRRPAATPAASPAAEIAAVPVAPAPEAQASPAAATATPAQPLGALPTTVVGQRFAGSQVSVSDTQPPRGSDVTATLRLVREGQPVPNANVFLVAHYRTLDERQPPGTSTVRTDENGVANITFNIGEATAGFEVKLDVTVLIEGQQVAFQSSFTPR